MLQWFLKLKEEIKFICFEKSGVIKVINLLAILVLFCSFSVLVIEVIKNVRAPQSCTKLPLSYKALTVPKFFTESINDQVYKQQNIMLVKHDLDIIHEAVRNDVIPLKNTVHIFAKYKDFLRLLINLYKKEMLGNIKSINIYPAQAPGMVEVQMVSEHDITFKRVQ